MDFIKKEGLYTNGEILVKGKKGFKYADIIVGCGDNYYHAVFLKWLNFFTIMMDDYETLPTTEIASKVLTILSEVDICGPDSEKIDKGKIRDLLSSLNSDKTYYKIGNYIVRTAENSLPCKKAKFILNNNISVTNIDACITNMSTVIRVIINNESKLELDKYDKLFFVSVNKKNVFEELLCLKAYPDNDNIVLELVSEREYFMNHTQLNGVKIVGNFFGQCK